MIYKKFYQHTIKVNGATIDPPIDSTLKSVLKGGKIEHLTMVSWPEGSSLDFLKELDFIRSINIRLEGPIDISPINSLKNLEYFESSNNRVIGKIDFKNFTHLKYLNFGYSDQVFENFSSLKNIVELTVNNWPFEDVSRLSHLTKIKELKLDFAKKLKSLSGIEKLKHLDFLDIYSAPKLEDISDLQSNAKTLRRLGFELANKVRDFHVLDRLKNIERFSIYRSAPLHSVQFIKHLQNLK
ncbi:MAG: hypothetical protein H7Y86_02525, partial [Rhizobacter sp.]|nr:hypothetical protein [Ferruginibacter sp.]